MNPSLPSPDRGRRTGALATASLGALALVGTLAVPAQATPVPISAEVPAPAGASFLAPYYTELDLTGDDQVTQEDLAVVAAALGATPTSADWIAEADVDGDGLLTLADLAAISQRMIYDDGPFELVEASVVEMQAAMNAGVVTSVDLTQAYAERIAAYDRVQIDPAGRPLNSIITVSDVALAAAAEADATRAANGMTSMLLGVPIALKDNYNTIDMPTSGGCECWADNRTSTDSTMVEGLRADGAVILAKASLDEFAYGFASEFTTGLSAGRSALVASPYLTTRTAGGSSGGTGAAVSANLVGLGFGTDTGGSIRVPSSYNQLVGIRPTVGLASRSGIIPLALSQDTGGPMARTVTDAAVALDAVVGVDASDPVTLTQAGRVPTSYTSSLDAESLDGARIGYLPSMLSTNRTTLRLWGDARVAMEEAGASFVEVPISDEFRAVLNEGSGSTNEFKHDLDLYVAEHLAPQVQQRTITDILASGNFVNSRRSVYVQRDNVLPATYESWAGPQGTHTLQLARGKVLLAQLMDTYDLDAIAYPSGTPYGTFSTNMRLSPNTGMPSVTVPMGQAIEADATITGAGVNLELLGRDFSEGTLLGLAYAFEQATQARTTPALYGPLG
ncbi:amidase family protein [Serinibacter arcticus]|uniref:amidase family protein n=1 Tax=Serinibacter arcticus TaxID=1655435 RepID=UPI001EEE0B40|nr:amidase family protein [Serinibacter arcticus]